MLVLDVGTSMLKACVVDAHGEFVSSATRRWSCTGQEGISAGLAFQPEQLAEEMLCLGSEALERAGRVADGIIVSTQRLGFVFLDEGGVPLPRREGCWLPVPVEYKRGSSKQIDADRLQLCGQGLCLEEMLCCQVPKGYLYYGETRRREEVLFTEELRKQTKAMLREMHGLYERRHTPKVKPTKSCNACSLKDLCLPKLCTRLSAKDYLNARLEEENR